MPSPPNVRARRLEFTGSTFVVELDDGRSLTVPFDEFPRVQNATPEQREKWQMIGRGLGIHWREIDEDISVAGLLGLPD